VIHLATWYCFSASATFTNKVLIKQHHVSAEMLTLSHLFVSVICDCTSLLLLLVYYVGEVDLKNQSLVCMLFPSSHRPDVPKYARHVQHIPDAVHFPSEVHR
jgi:hypothetical protein